MGVDAEAKLWLEENVGPVSSAQKLGGSGWASFAKYSVEGSERDYFVKVALRLELKTAPAHCLDPCVLLCSPLSPLSPD